MPPRVVVLVSPTYNAPIDTIDPVFTDDLAGKVELLSLAQAFDGLAQGQTVDGVLSLAHPVVSDELLEKLGPGIKIISNYGVGCDHIDLEAAHRRGILVGNTPGVLTDATADMGFALLMACARLIPLCDAYARSSAYTSYKNMLFLGKDITGATLGILGMGRIGLEVARRGTGFKMTILYHNRSIRAEAESVGASYVDLDTLLQQSDFLVIVCPSTAQTRGLIDAEALSKMKPSAYLINIARGDIVNTTALYEALASGRLAGAGLDVTDPEPLPRDHPINTLPNVVLVPHRGSATAETRAAMRKMTVDNLLCGLAGQPLLASI